MSFALPPAIGLALACAFLPVVLLWLAARLFGPTTKPGRRLVAAQAIAFVAWSFAIAALRLFDAAWEDLIAALLILLGGIVATFTLWSLLAWGFTSTLLLTLSRADRALTLDEWIGRYTQGGDLTTFTRNRLGVLFGLGLARETSQGIQPRSGWATAVGTCAGYLRLLFGLKT